MVPSFLCRSFSTRGRKRPAQRKNSIFAHKCTTAECVPGDIPLVCHDIYCAEHKMAHVNRSSTRLSTSCAYAPSLVGSGAGLGTLHASQPATTTLFAIRF